jgi:hypothetical protein
VLRKLRPIPVWSELAVSRLKTFTVFMKRCCSTIVLSLLFWLLATGCRTPCNEAVFAQPFDSPKVARLAHESYKLAWDARLSAQTDLRFASSRPTHLDWSVIRYLERISVQLPWIAAEIEKHPDAPRCTSKFSYDAVAINAGVLKTAYRPDAFKARTNEQIERLLRNLAEISGYYQVK